MNRVIINANISSGIFVSYDELSIYKYILYDVIKKICIVPVDLKKILQAFQI